MANSTYILTINGKPVKLGDDYSLISLRAQYGAPRELTFATPQGVKLALNATVELKVNDTVRFLGRIFDDNRDPKLANQNAWTARDLSELAVDVSANQDLNFGSPERQAAAVQLAGFFSRLREDPLAEFLSLVDTAMGDDLRALGVCDGPIFSGATSGTLPKFSVAAGGFPQVLSAALSGLPGYRWFWRPQTKTFHIVNAYSAPEVTFELTQDIVESLPISRSLNGRYSTVKLIGTWREGVVPTRGNLTPAWNAALEPQWTIKKFGNPVGLVVGAPAPMDVGMADVFRKYSFADYKDYVLADFPITLYQFVPFDRFDTSNGEWISIQISEIDYTNGYIWARFPALQSRNDRQWTGRNANIPGKSKRAVDMCISFTQKALFPPPQIVVGPTGDAYSQYGFQRQLVLRDFDNREVSTARANLILNAVKDVAISGTIPLRGQMPDALWDMGSRLNVKGKGVETRLESAKAVMSGYTYSFDGGGRADLEVGNERSDYLGATTA